jgi:transposase InsO family protein
VIILIPLTRKPYANKIKAFNNNRGDLVLIIFIFVLFYYSTKSLFMSDMQKSLEIIGLRSQLAFFQTQVETKKIAKPRLNNLFRLLWVFLSKNLNNWQSSLMIVKPETVIKWHKRAFKFYWRRKSKGGRPKISAVTIALIKRIHKENPALSPEKIHERLLALNITDTPAPNTIAKYIRDKRKAPTEKQKQSWRNFLKNHAKGIWAMDFAVVPTLTFKVLYVLFIISHDRRKIEHFAVTEYTSASWVTQQIRNATPYGKSPVYLIHDNEPAFKEASFQQFLLNSNIKSKSITPRHPWQNGISERLIGIVRRELLDYVIPLNQRHLERLLSEYVYYYNNVRTHKALGGEPPNKPPIPIETKVENTGLHSKPILGGLYHDYEKYSGYKSA